VIGLGRMGGAIARNVLRSGVGLRVYNRTPDRAASLAEHGATVAASPAEAADGVSVVVSSLLDDEAAMSVLEGSQGLLAGLAPGAVHIGTSTISPSAANTIAALHAQAGSRYVAGPVLGRPERAEAGTLTSLLAGDVEALEIARPVVRAYSETLIEVGEDHGVANSLKLGVNYWTVSLVELIGQLYAYSEKTGIGTERMLDTIKMLLERPTVREYAERIAARDYVPAGFALSAGLKDVELILDAATAAGAPLPYANVVRAKMQRALSDDPEADLDWSAIAEISRADAGLEEAKA
jgi:3-hydroxyisobutyrate dehydrogenase-like beta-hydroxyacid dehydrogenase